MTRNTPTLKVSDTQIVSHHGNTRIAQGDTVTASGGMSVPTGKCVVVDVSEDDHSGDVTVLLAQKRDGGDVARVPASTIDAFYPRQ